MLKTHGANSEKLPWPTGTCTALEARSQEALSDYDGADKGDLTIVGELNKLASTAALGRNFAGVHFRSDGDQGLAIGEQIAIQYLKSKLQEYALKSALNSFILERFDGTIIEITASGGTGSEASRADCEVLIEYISFISSRRPRLPSASTRRRSG